MLLQLTSNFLILLYHKYADIIYHFIFYAYLSYPNMHICVLFLDDLQSKVCLSYVYCMFLNQGPHRYI